MRSSNRDFEHNYTLDHPIFLHKTTTDHPRLYNGMCLLFTSGPSLSAFLILFTWSCATDETRRRDHGHRRRGQHRESQPEYPPESAGYLYIPRYVLLSPPCRSTSFAHSALVPQLPTPSAKDSFREIQVKVHLRSFGKDTWTYQGRGMVTQEITGHSSRVGTSLS